MGTTEDKCLWDIPEDERHCEFCLVPCNLRRWQDNLSGWAKDIIQESKRLPGDMSTVVDEDFWKLV